MNGSQLRYIADEIALERAIGHGRRVGGLARSPAPTGHATGRPAGAIGFFGDDGSDFTPPPAPAPVSTGTTVDTGFAKGQLDEAGVLRTSDAAGAAVAPEAVAEGAGGVEHSERVGYGGVAVVAAAMAAVVWLKAHPWWWIAAAVVWVPIWAGLVN